MSTITWNHSESPRQYFSTLSLQHSTSHLEDYVASFGFAFPTAKKIFACDEMDARALICFMRYASENEHRSSVWLLTSAELLREVEVVVERCPTLQNTCTKCEINSRSSPEASVRSDNGSNVTPNGCWASSIQPTYARRRKQGIDSVLEL